MLLFRRVLVLGAALALAPLALAAVYDTVVTGANDPAVDVTAVQAAANGGGGVLLVGTFDFGPDGSIAVTRDVRFEGQLGPKGEPLTIILGGLRTFYLDAPASLALRSIRFTESFGVPILVRRGTGLEVDGVEIFNVRADPRWWGEDGVLATAGVMISPWDVGGVTGLVSIRNTAIRLNPDPSNSPVYDAQHGHGIDVSFTAADVEILDNVVENTGCNAVTAFDNTGRVVISGNTLLPGPDQIPGLNMGNGIFAGAYFLTDQARGPVVIARNTIRCVHPWADGILFDDWFPLPHGDALIQKNDIFMENSECCGAITLGESASRVSVLQNRIDGRMVYAVGSGPGWGVALEDNAIVGNNFARASVTWCHVVLGPETFRHVVNGSCGDVVDEGTDNVVAGTGRKDVPAGPAIREAMQRKKALLDQGR